MLLLDRFLPLGRETVRILENNFLLEDATTFLAEFSVCFIFVFVHRKRIKLSVPWGQVFM